MANKMSFILSLFFLMQILAYAGDLSIVSTIYTTLDALSVSVSQLIAKEGAITDSIRTYVVSSCPKASIEAVGDDQVAFGEMLSYRLYMSYKPLIMSNKEMEISLVRGAVIGYLDP